MADFKASDLQIAKVAIASSAGTASMVHKMGLAEIELKTSTYYAVTEANSGTSSITRTQDTNENVTASSSFSTTSPYHLPTRKGTSALYYAVVPTGSSSSTQFNSTTGTDQWSSVITATNISSGEVGHYDAYSARVGTSKYSGSFSYSGTGLTFTAPFKGTYTIECWGASGGNSNSNVNAYGRGAYVKGDISLSKDAVLYIYIGQQGATSSSTAWNGGGPKGTESLDGSGGGATDIRTKTGLNSTQLAAWATAWSDDYGLRGRIMVAAGGAGSDDTSGAEGAYGVSGYTNSNVFMAACAGGLYAPSPAHNNPSVGGNNYGATQTSYGYHSKYTSGHGDFGRGNSSSITQCSGGGSGYWGGGASDLVGMGGSCYISGHPGCIAIASAAGTTASDAGSDNSVERATHYSGLKFTNTVMIDGAGYSWTTSKGSATTMPTPPGGTISYGNVGNGYCRIAGTSTVP